MVINPVAGLHRIWADGDAASLVMSRRSRPAEFAGDHSSLLFRRAPNGVLDLVGYVVPFNHKAWSYMLQHSAAREAPDPGTLAVARAKGELVTLIASQSPMVR
jgi:hypothetical protein